MYLLDLLMQHSSHRHVYFLKFSQIKKTKDINTPKHVNKGIAEQNIYLLVINIGQLQSLSLHGIPKNM